LAYYVYILYSVSIDSFYKGQTQDLQDRLKRHNNKQEISTSAGAPWILIWQAEKPSKGEAMKLESKLKNLSRERLINLIAQYTEGIAGPDAHSLIEKWSGC
jgi:putative endonuclease